MFYISLRYDYSISSFPISLNTSIALVKIQILEAIKNYHTINLKIIMCLLSTI